ncbi:MAG: single-stranded DNA-binding protein [bacterium]|nr:single-stranded DNA-binding protein [bacterium]
MNLNKVTLIGRLTGDPQLRTTPAGQQVATFSMATNRTWNDKSGVKKEDVQFHNIVVWGRQAEVAQRFLTKGGLVLIVGRLQSRDWTDKTGGKRRTTEIVAEFMQLGPRSAGNQGGGFTPRPQEGAAPQSGFAPASQRGEPAQEIPSIDLDAPHETPADFFPEEDHGIKPEDLNF